MSTNNLLSNNYQMLTSAYEMHGGLLNPPGDTGRVYSEEEKRAGEVLSRFGRKAKETRLASASAGVDGSKDINQEDGVADAKTLDDLGLALNKLKPEKYTAKSIFNLLNNRNLLYIDGDKYGLTTARGDREWGDQAGGATDLVGEMELDGEAILGFEKFFNQMIRVIKYDPLEKKPVYINKTSGPDMYGFLPRGGIDTGYETHLPGPDDIEDLAGASAVVNRQFVRPMMMPMAFMGEGKPAQSGGAIVVTNAPTVRKYCSGSNFLLQELNRIERTMKDKGITLSEASGRKLERLKKQLATSEQQLCDVYDDLDLLVASTKTVDGVSTNAKITNLGNVNINDVRNKRDMLRKEVKKIQTVLFSSIMTLIDVVDRGTMRAFTKIQKQSEKRQADPEAAQAAADAAKAAAKQVATRGTGNRLTGFN